MEHLRVWPLFLTREVQLSKQVPPDVTKDAILSVLHDPNRLLRLSPLATSVVPDPAAPGPQPTSASSSTTAVNVSNSHSQGLNSFYVDLEAQKEAAESGWWYTVTDRLPLLGGLIESTTQFRVKWSNVEDGGNSEVRAGAGTRLKSEMRVRKLDTMKPESMLPSTTPAPAPIDGPTGSLSQPEKIPTANTLIFEEKLVIQALAFFMPFIKTTATNSHIVFQDRLFESAFRGMNPP